MNLETALKTETPVTFFISLMEALVVFFKSSMMLNASLLLDAPSGLGRH